MWHFPEGNLNNDLFVFPEALFDSIVQDDLISKFQTASVNSEPDCGYGICIFSYFQHYKLYSSHHVVSQNVAWLVLDSCVDFIFIADVFICFLTTIVAENGETVDDRNIIQVRSPIIQLYTYYKLKCIQFTEINL